MAQEQLRRLPEQTLKGILRSQEPDSFLDSPSRSAVVERSNGSIAVTTKKGGYNLGELSKAMDYYHNTDQLFSSADRAVLGQMHLFLEVAMGKTTDVFYVAPRFRWRTIPPQENVIDWYIRGEHSLLRAAYLTDRDAVTLECGVDTRLHVASGKLPKSPHGYRELSFHLGTITQITAVSGNPQDFTPKRGRQVQTEAGRLIQRMPQRR